MARYISFWNFLIPYHVVRQQLDFSRKDVKLEIYVSISDGAALRKKCVSGVDERLVQGKSLVAKRFAGILVRLCPWFRLW
jgi:hypothetical protein